MLDFAYLFVKAKVVRDKVASKGFVHSVAIIPNFPFSSVIKLRMQPNVNVDTYTQSLHPINLVFGFLKSCGSSVGLIIGSSAMSSPRIKYQTSVALVLCPATFAVLL